MARYIVGETARLLVNFYDASGAAMTPESPSATLKAADGTTSTPTILTAGDGQRYCDVLTTPAMVGKNRFRASCSGPIACAAEVFFEVMASTESPA